jgi:chloride channel protein, CIC family
MAKAERGVHEDKVLLLLTLIIGAVVGLVVVAFIVLTERLGSRMYPAGGSAWRRVLVPVVGSLVTGFLLFRYFPNARGSGIPQTKAAMFLHDGYISLRTVLGKFGLCSVSLASGIALGREGPSVQVGAGIASVLGRKLGLSPASVKALVPVGASAALAAAFNTPIAAVLFSLEEVMGDMHAPVLGSIVLGSATSWIVLHLILGDEPLFHVPAYQLVHPVEFAVYAVLGVVGGLVSVGFVKLLLWQRRRFMSLPKASQWLQPAAGGLTVGLIGWFFPEVLGVGYGFVSKALNGELLIGAMALLVFLKIVATSTCYASGNAGGIFGPSLFIGAMMGGAVGGVAHQLMPDYTGSVGAYALVGMGAAFAGVVRVPLTSVIMIFEITRDYSIIVPLMIANLVSYWISSKLQDEPIYEALQHQEGIYLPAGAKDRDKLLLVNDAFVPGTATLAADLTVQAALRAVDWKRGAWPVADDAGLRGMATAAQLEEALIEGRGNQRLADVVPASGRIAELSEEQFPRLYVDHSLDLAMRRLVASGMKVMPVVSRENLRMLKGTISLDDVMAAYGIGGARRREVAPVPGKILSRRLVGGASAVLIALGILAGCLNYFYRAERTNRAEAYLLAGNQLLAKDRAEESIEQYRNALSINHTLPYRLGLGLALARSEQDGEARIYLEEVLREQAGNGPAHLAMAEIESRSRQTSQAVSDFQRAIYGTWPSNALRGRLQARLELVDLLSGTGQQQRAAAELMAMAADAPKDEGVLRQIAVRLVKLHMTEQAAAIYRQVTALDERDGGSWAGLGEADLSLAHFGEACTAFQHARSTEPDNIGYGERLALCEEIVAHDPKARGISAAERRGRILLLEKCSDPKTAAGCPASEVLARLLAR